MNYDPWSYAEGTIIAEATPPLPGQRLFNFVKDIDELRRLKVALDKAECSPIYVKVLGFSLPMSVSDLKERTQLEIERLGTELMNAAYEVTNATA